MDTGHQDKIKELAGQYAELLIKQCEFLYKSGGIDPERFDPKYYGLAKILITAAIVRTKDTYEPMKEEYIDHVYNLLNI